MPKVLPLSVRIQIVDFLRSDLTQRQFERDRFSWGQAAEVVNKRFKVSLKGDTIKRLWSSGVGHLDDSDVIWKPDSHAAKFSNGVAHTQNEVTRLGEIVRAHAERIAELECDVDGLREQLETLQNELGVKRG
jgi:hypothetical protein